MAIQSVGHEFKQYTLGDQIAVLRIRKGLKRHELARLAGITRQGLDLIEENKVNPKVTTLRRIFAVLGYGIELVGLEKANEPDPDEAEDGHV